jgi:Ca2+:H+ antiporter
VVLPTFTTSTPGPEFSAAQLALAAVASLALYLLFVFVQNVRHRDDFLPTAQTPMNTPPRPQTAEALLSLGMVANAFGVRVGWDHDLDRHIHWESATSGRNRHSQQQHL